MPNYCKKLRTLILASFLILTSLQERPCFADPTDFLISLDLDQLIWDRVTDKEIQAGDKIIEVRVPTLMGGGSVKIRLHPDAPAFIQSLVRIPHVKIGFCTMAAHWISNELLIRAQLPNGLSFLGAAEGRLIARDTPGLPFPSAKNGGYKDLRNFKQFLPDLPLEQTIHLDDQAGVILPEQKKHILWAKQEDLIQGENHEKFLNQIKLELDPIFAPSPHELPETEADRQNREALRDMSAQSEMIQRQREIPHTPYDPLRLVRLRGALEEVFTDFSLQQSSLPASKLPGRSIVQRMYEKQWIPLLPLLAYAQKQGISALLPAADCKERGMKNHHYNDFFTESEETIAKGKAALKAALDL